MRLKARCVRRKTEQGDLYVRFLIKLPPGESPELERAVDAIAAHQTDDPRSSVKF